MCSGEPLPRGASCSVTSTRPPVSDPSALIVVSPPKNQRCSPSPARRATGAAVPVEPVMAVSCVVDIRAPTVLAQPAADYPPAQGDLFGGRGTLAGMAWSPGRLLEEIDLLGSRALPREEFFAELSPRLREVIPNDASCWHTLDPY